MTPRRKMRTSFAGLIVCAFFSYDSLGGPNIPLTMAKIPGVTLQLGSTIDEIVEATANCSRRNRLGRIGPLCEPDDLFNEIAGGAPAKVKSFFMDITETSVDQYEQCVQAMRCRPPAFEHSVKAFRAPQAPVVLISYFDAEDYCRFRKARLPTEAEFEVAVRTTARRIYPWGNYYFRAFSNGGSMGAIKTDPSDGFDLIAPVDSFFSGRSRHGIMNLAGNVAEWTQSVFLPHGTPSEQAESGPKKQVVKGGHFAAPPHELRGTARRAEFPNARRTTIGFRCARAAN